MVMPPTKNLVDFESFFAPRKIITGETPKNEDLPVKLEPMPMQFVTKSGHIFIFLYNFVKINRLE